MLGRKQSIKIGDTSLLEATSGCSAPTGVALTGGGLAIAASGGSGAGGGLTGGGNASSCGPTNLEQRFGGNAEPIIPSIELAHGRTGVAWFSKTSVRHFMRICSVASLVSVCANTSRTFSLSPSLMLLTFIVDVVTGIVFTIEMVFKIHSRWFQKRWFGFRKRWFQFDMAMVVFIWFSIILSVSTAHLGGTHPP